MKASFRFLWMLCFLVVGNLTSNADTTDKNLERAKAEYETEMSEVKKQVLTFLDKLETSARKSGNKAMLDFAKAEREEYESVGVLPQSLPILVRKKFHKIHDTLDLAFTTAIKEFTKLKRDLDATATEKELRLFRVNRLVATFQIQGKWKSIHGGGSGWSGVFEVVGSEVRFASDQRRGKWERSGATVTVHYPGGGVSETVTLDPDSPNELKGSSSKGGGPLVWVREK